MHIIGLDLDPPLRIARIKKRERRKAKEAALEAAETVRRARALALAA